MISFTHFRTCIFSAWLCSLSLAWSPAHADFLGGLFSDDQPMHVEIADPYIEMHTGAGEGYPIFNVEERGAWVEILKRKTDWFKVRTDKGKEGWVAREQLERTLTPSGENVEIRDATKEEFSFHRWEGGAMGGDFEGADVMSAYGGFFFTPKFSVEVAASKVFDDFSDSDMAVGSALIHPFPEWRFSPFFTIGTGVIRTDPKKNQPQLTDSTDQLAQVGAGLRVYLARRFIFRAEYKHYVIFKSQPEGNKKDDNKEIDEWKAGFAVFF